MRALLVLLALALPAAGCNIADGDDAEETSLDQEVVFEISHLNHAWGYRLGGWYIDGRGRLWRYDHSDEPWSAPGDTIPAADLLEKVTRERELAGTVPGRELARMASLIDEAAGATIGDPVGTGCYDFGTVTWLAYRWLRAQDAYVPVLLHQQGDVARPVDGDAAATIYAWLREVAGFDGEPPCEP